MLSDSPMDATNGAQQPPQANYSAGQQALLGAKGAEESQGRKDHGIRRPWVHKAKCLINVTKTEVSKTLGLATDLTNASDRSAARTLPKARLTYFSRLTVLLTKIKIGRQLKIVSVC